MNISNKITYHNSIYNALISGYKAAGYDDIIDENSYKGYIIHTLSTYAPKELKIGDIITEFNGVKFTGLTGTNEFQDLVNKTITPPHAWYFYTTIPEDNAGLRNEFGNVFRSLDDFFYSLYGTRCILHDRENAELLLKTDHYVPLMRDKLSDSDYQELETAVEIVNRQTERLRSLTFFKNGKIIPNEPRVKNLLENNEIFPVSYKSYESLKLKMQEWLLLENKRIIDSTTYVDTATKSIKVNNAVVAHFGDIETDSTLSKLADKVNRISSGIEIALQHEEEHKAIGLQVKYNEGQSWAYTDHEKGLLSDEDFYKINDSRMDTYVEGVDSKYILSREDVEFIAEYGALDVDGQLLKTILRKDLLDRLALIKQIFRSVVIFSYFDSFDGITKRTKFKDDVVKTFGSEKEKSVKMLERIKQTRGANYQNSPHFLETKQRLDNANKALRFAEHIITFDDDYLYRLLASYYEVKYNYYDWYRRMSLKEENDNGFVYQEHLGLMQKINGDISCLSVKRKTLEEEQGEARKVSSDLIKFLEAIADFDLTKFDVDNVVCCFKDLLTFLESVSYMMSAVIEYETEMKLYLGV